MAAVEELKVKYPGANAWQMGDSPELASELADLIKKGIKTASCGSFGNDSNLLIVFYVQIMPDDFVMQLHR
ncbi:hypothetical protein M8S04_07015, partial [Enterobacter ludwigii]|nr:hypothetical protein [Enterobacter ludwigii]